MHLLFKIFLIFFIFAINVQSQDLDKDYLASLPDDIRNDILNSFKEKETFAEPVYTNIDTNLNKDRDLDETRKASVIKKIYGQDFFNSFQSTFMPINEPNFDAEYILDYGDILNIQLVGQKEFIDSFKVSRNGTINIPTLGSISLAGLTLKEASKIINAKIQSSYIGTESFVSLENIRDINVMIAGDVYKPGVYTLSGNSNALHALVVAGGINEFGSYRDIKVKRNGEIIQSIDIYDYLIFANPFKNIRLRSGDFIFVESQKKLVSVSGAVKRPMFYELKDDETLDNAIEYAKGFSSQANKSSIFVDSINNGKIVRIQIKKKSNLKNYIAKDEDSIYVSDYKLRPILISGAVNTPGRYLINEGDGILDVINRAGGYTKNAYPFGGILTSESAKEVGKKANELIYKELIKSIFELVSISENSNTSDLTTLIQIAQSIKNYESLGRVDAEFNLDKLKNNSDLDILLQSGDEIIIPEKVDHIYVYGEISNTGTIKYEKEKKLFTYIDELGGLLENADKANIFVIAPNGRAYKIKNRKKIFMNINDNNNIPIYPGSIIFIPRKIDNSFVKRQTLQAYTSILGNLGVSLASLSVLKD